MKRILFIAGLVAVFITLTIPATLTCRKSAAKARAISNAKQVSIALIEFDSLYGHFPNAQIPTDLQSDYPQQDRHDSNYILGQLLAAKVIDTEQIFAIKAPSTSGDIIEPTSEILKAGECQFSYISQAGDIPMALDAPFPASTPILLAPMIAGTRRFDQNFFRGQPNIAIYSKLDSSVGITIVSDEGRALRKGSGITGLLETGPETAWGDRIPIIHQPLPYKGAPSANSPIWKAPLFTRESSPPILALILISLAIAYYFFERWRTRSRVPSKVHS